jgi:hypothetical protein
MLPEGLIVLAIINCPVAALFDAGPVHIVAKDRWSLKNLVCVTMLLGSTFFFSLLPSDQIAPYVLERCTLDEF